MRTDFHAIPTHVLTEALERVESGRAQPPWSTSFAFDLPSIAAVLARLNGVPASGIVALISAVLEERRVMPHLTEIVWTGPEPAGATTRDTAAVVAGMFRDAQREVLVSCYSLDAKGDAARSLFAPLHAAMLARGVNTTIFFDVEWCAKAAGTSRVEATKPNIFMKLYWPFGPPFPSLYFDPRAVQPGQPCSMHAKMVIADRRFVLVGSANLTDRGLTRNIELGVKLDDVALAERIAEHWMGAVAIGAFQRCT
jgi:hypothetical protein